MNFNRRQFLSSVSATAVAAALPPVLRAFKPSQTYVVFEQFPLEEFEPSFQTMGKKLLAEIVAKTPVDTGRMRKELLEAAFDDEGQYGN